MCGQSWKLMLTVLTNAHPDAIPSHISSLNYSRFMKLFFFFVCKTYIFLSQHPVGNLQIFRITGIYRENGSKIEWGAGVTRKTDICRLRALLSPAEWVYLLFWKEHFKTYQKLNEWRTGMLHAIEISRAFPKCWGKGVSLFSTLDETLWHRLHNLVVLYKPECHWQGQLHTWVVKSFEECLAAACPETPLLLPSHLLLKGTETQTDTIIRYSSIPLQAK